MPDQHKPHHPHWYLFRGSELLVRDRQGNAALPSEIDIQPLRSSLLHVQSLEALDGTPVFAADLPLDTVTPSGMRFAGLRTLHGQLESNSFRMAGRAVQIVDWDRDNQFCGRCGAGLQQKMDERAKLCPDCGLVLFPRLDPAIIVLVRRGDALLLARSPKFPAGRYSTLAGFVEPGESLEEAVHREVLEEVGVRLTNLQYFGSQPWPFPRSLMVGFTAEYAGGELRFQAGEIADACWFALDALPDLPPPLSIARQLINSAIKPSGA